MKFHEAIERGTEFRRSSWEPSIWMRFDAGGNLIYTHGQLADSLIRREWFVADDWEIKPVTLTISFEDLTTALASVNLSNSAVKYAWRALQQLITKEPEQ